MKTRARAFLEMWLAKNVPHTPTPPERLRAEAAADAQACLRSASIVGISRLELEQECDLLGLFVAFRENKAGY